MSTEENTLLRKEVRSEDAVVYHKNWKEPSKAENDQFQLQLKFEGCDELSNLIADSSNLPFYVSKIIAQYADPESPRPFPRS